MSRVWVRFARGGMNKPERRRFHQKAALDSVKPQYLGASLQVILLKFRVLRCARARAVSFSLPFDLPQVIKEKGSPGGQLYMVNDRY